MNYLKSSKNRGPKFGCIRPLNKLQAIKSDIVRIDEKWETWEMHDLIENIHAWLRRNKPDDTRRETGKREHWYAEDSNNEKRKPKCIYCDAEHWSDSVINMKQQRKGNNISEIKNCASIVERKGTEKTSVSVEDVSIAKQNIIAAYVKRKKRKVLY